MNSGQGKKIAVLTRDCAGVNAAIRAIVRTADRYHLNVLGVINGYDGLIDNSLIPLDGRSVSGIINRGGTILKTTRSKRFFYEEGQKKAVDTIKSNNIDGVIVIGGDGSLRGAHVLSSRYHIPVIGIPATIDNDINGIDLAIGSNTAVNVALDALDKIRDTATSLERIFVIEVMGRACGYLALQVALAGGCEDVLLPEKEYDIGAMCEEIRIGTLHGKKSWIIIVAEGKAKGEDVARMITDRTGLETRVTVLGHIQRGGVPSASDRVLGARLGAFAVTEFLNGSNHHCVSIRDNKTVLLPLEVVVKPKKIDVEYSYRLLKFLS